MKEKYNMKKCYDCKKEVLCTHSTFNSVGNEKLPVIRQLCKSCRIADLKATGRENDIIKDLPVMEWKEKLAIQRYKEWKEWNARNKQ